PGRCRGDGGQRPAHGVFPVTGELLPMAVGTGLIADVLDLRPHVAIGGGKRQPWVGDVRLRAAGPPGEATALVHPDRSKNDEPEDPAPAQRGPLASEETRGPTHWRGVIHEAATWGASPAELPIAGSDRNLPSLPEHARRGSLTSAGGSQ